MENYIEYFSKSGELIKFLNSLHKKGIKQAYIFNSFDDIKNYNASLLFSMIINCKNENKPCQICSNCVKLKSLSAIDLFVYPKNNASILVEDIENIIETCYVMPNEMDFKVYILNDFDKANISSQNKFLKTLEEPPSNVIFVLTTTNLDKILQTIKSRCEIINLPATNQKEFYEIFNKQLNMSILENSNYELGKFLALTNNDKFNDIFDFCLNLAENMNTSKDILKFANKILSDKENLEIYFSCMINIFRDLLAVKINTNYLINKSIQQKIETISKGFHSEALKNILKYFLVTNNELNFNTNESLIVDCLLLKIVEEKNKWNKK